MNLVPNTNSEKILLLWESEYFKYLNFDPSFLSLENELFSVLSDNIVEYLFGLNDDLS